MKYNHIDGVKVSVLTLNGVNRGLEPLTLNGVDRGLEPLTLNGVDRGLEPLTLNGVDRGLEPCWVKPKTIKLFISASLLSMQH